MQVAVFCSSSDKLADVYSQEAESLGRFLGKESYSLIYGGSNRGLMESLARAVKEESGYIIGILPSNLRSQASQHCDELFFVETLSERKEMLQEYADYFVALPGGFGTLDEMFEIIASAQVGAHDKKLIIVNINGFFDDLLNFFDKIYKEKFCPEKNKNFYLVVNNVDECAKYLKDNAL
jgi:uncharacterized protein (TIGR00730 family)